MEYLTLVFNAFVEWHVQQTNRFDRQSFKVSESVILSEPSELLQMRWENLWLEHNTLEVFCKNVKGFELREL